MPPKQPVFSAFPRPPQSADEPGPENPRRAEGQQNLAMVLAYDGSPFQGWQVQPHGPSVQGILEEALSTVCRQPVKVYGSGRTDTGVHALGQVANFFAPLQQDLHKLQASLNGMAAPAISVMGLTPVAHRFHARHSAIGKTYRYHIFNRVYPPVFGRDRCWWIRMPLNLAAMEEAGQALVGTHDFSAFRAKECAAKSPIREIRRLSLSEAEHGDGEIHDSTIRIEIEASGFLQHMARIITGTLIAVGLGRLSPSGVERILAGKDREAADMTAPGKGLYLVRVEYNLEAFPELRMLKGLGGA